MLRAETLSQFEMRSISWACSSEVSSSERCITSLAARWIDSMLDLRLANSASNAWKQTHATTITTTTTTTTTPRDTCNYGNNYNDYNNYYYNNYNNNTNYNHNKYNNNFSDTKKFDRGLSRLLHDKLHWLDVPERVTFKLGLMTLFARTSTSVLADHIKPAIEVASRHRLRSANRHWLIVPRCRLNTYGRRAFPVAGPTVWNSLPDELRDPACDIDSFKHFFKTILFSQYWCDKRIRG